MKFSRKRRKKHKRESGHKVHANVRVLSLLCFLRLLRLNSKEAFNSREDAGGRVGAGGGVLGLGGEALAALGHDETQGFDEVRVCVKYPLHRRVADFEDLSFFERKNVCRPRLACK